MDRKELISALEINLFQCELVYYREPRKGRLWEALLATWAQDLLENAAWAQAEDLDRAFRVCRQTRTRYPTPCDIIRILADMESERAPEPEPVIQVERVERTAELAKYYLEKWRARKAYGAAASEGQYPAANPAENPAGKSGREIGGEVRIVRE